ncbi:general secretion pathway protein E [Prosthecobacter debontii]|uniref:General secretion pathway protein E n=1 Tax=Prosthecobacter debontii TaxID=48467 RepID=A0A1T4XA21_9BACT|nr:GspE/PulE family protein [Prosthecobacter debontii]SKA86450.1 general secretion pathway protein E [Prosthecobacter debontii]
MKNIRQALVQCMEVSGGSGIPLPVATPSSSVINQLLDMGALDEDAFLSQLAARVGLGYVNIPVPDSADAPEMKRLLPPRIALKHRLLPLKIEEEEGQAKKLIVAAYDPFDLIGRQAVAREVDAPVRWQISSRKRLLNAMRDFYGVGADTFEEILKGRDVDGADLEQRDEANIIDADDEEASVVKFVNTVIREALEQHATDIHVEPMEDKLRMRYRIDGRLREVPVPENIKQLQQSVIARLKVMAKLDIAERRLPQDGRINLQVGGQSIDVRVATIPSVEGESVSLRLLGQEKFNLDRLRMETDLRGEIEVLLKKPNGIILVTGPTGSGKSTTLYTFLSQLNTEHRRIVTIEDPVENKLPGVVQIAVRPEIELTFATGLRSILRGDPNVVMVGEMRDLETAEIAIRAALTGHLVFSTLHTNDAIGGIMRLVDMGVEPFLVASSVRAFIAQRLVRLLCNECKEPEPDAEIKLRELKYTGPIRTQVYRAREGGCEACRHTGYRGRMSIYELVRLTPAMGELVTHKASSAQLMQQAYKDGYRPMREYGVRKVLAGNTTIEEVISVTVAESEQ